MSSQNRPKTFILSTTSHYGKSIVSIIIGIVLVPMGLHYFGPVRYGIWAVISSVIAYLNISNLGIPTATAVLTAKAFKPFEQWAILRRSLSLLLISSAIVLSTVLAIAHFYPNWVVVLGKIPVDLHKEAAEAATAVAILFLLNLPITIFSAGFIGFQKFYWERFYASLTSIAGLFALILAVLLKGNLVTLALFGGFATLSVSVVCALHFLFAHPELRQKFSEPIGKEFSSKFIFVSSIRFFIMGIVAIVVWNTDNLVISHFLGVKAVTPYAVSFKLFTMAFTLFSAISSTLFPMYGKAAALNQWDWIQQTYQKATQLLPIMGGLIWIGGVAFAKNIIDLWVGRDAYIGLWTVFIFGGIGYLLSLALVHSSLLTGINTTKKMVLITGSEAIANIGISVALVKPLGTVGVALGTFLAGLLITAWLLPIDVYRQTSKRVKFNFYFVMRHAFFILIPCLIVSISIQHYWQNEISKIFINIIIISIYLILSWQVISPDLRNLFKSTIAEIYTRIKNLRVLNI